MNHPFRLLLGIFGGTVAQSTITDLAGLDINGPMWGIILLNIITCVVGIVIWTSFEE